MLTLKRAIKMLVAKTAYHTGLSAIYAGFANKNRPLILMYHCILPKEAQQRQYLQPGMITTYIMFDRQLSYVKKHYQIISMAELETLLVGSRPLPPGTAVITFDDGWLDNYRFAFPVLLKHGLPATIFLTTDYIGTNKLFWFLRLAMLMDDVERLRRRIVEYLPEVQRDHGVKDSAEFTADDLLNSMGQDRDKLTEWFKTIDTTVADALLDRLETEDRLLRPTSEVAKWTLDWSQVRRMNRENIDFGSHGCSHRILTGLSDADIHRELCESKNLIELKLGIACTSFAYPNGNFTDQVREKVAECRYKCAFAIRPTGHVERIDRYSLPRLGISDGISAGSDGKFSEALFACNLRRVLE